VRKCSTSWWCFAMRRRSRRRRQSTMLWCLEIHIFIVNVRHFHFDLSFRIDLWLLSIECFGWGAWRFGFQISFSSKMNDWPLLCLWSFLKLWAEFQMYVFCESLFYCCSQPMILFISIQIIMYDRIFEITTTFGCRLSI
jgi:hypothetical protein